MSPVDGDIVEIVERASSLYERLGRHFLPENPERDRDIIRERLSRWRAVSAAGDEEQFRRRLEWDGLDLQKVSRVLGSVRLAEGSPLPEWARFIHKVIARSPSCCPRSAKQNGKKIYRFLDRDDPIPFEDVFIPFVTVAGERLAACAGKAYGLFSPHAIASLERQLLYDLAYASEGALDLELKAFKAGKQYDPATGVTVFGSFPGSRSSDLYEEFVGRMLRERLPGFLVEYSSLARILGTTSVFWVESCETFLRRYAADRREVRQALLDNTDPGEVVDLITGLSDRHKCGKTVIALTFSSGARIVYKPKSMAQDEEFGRLLVWLGERDQQIKMEPLPMIDRDQYGWARYAEHGPCEDRVDVAGYFRRSGALLFLLYALGGTDCHLENVIAAGSTPILLDVETILQPHVRPLRPARTENARTVAMDQIAKSVLRTGLLPVWRKGMFGIPYDVGGLSGSRDHMPLVHSLDPAEINTDSMEKTSHYFAKYQDVHNRPILDGKKQSPQHYIEEITDGFKRAFDIFSAKRDEILADGGPLAGMKRLWVRFMFRDTATYDKILHRAGELENLRYGVDRTIQLDGLSRLFPSEDARPRFFSLLRAEIAALEQGDIPAFSSKSDSTDIFVTADESVLGCFEEPGFDSVVSQIRKLDGAALDRQISFVRGAYHSVHVERIHQAVLESKAMDFDTIRPLTRKELVDRAAEIAARLQSQAIRGPDGSVIWLGLTLNRESRRYDLLPMLYNLYDGMSGVALFYAALAGITREDRYPSMAYSALRTTREMLHRGEAGQIIEDAGIGGAAGFSSVIYSLARSGWLLNDPKLLNEARDGAALIEQEHIEAERQHDVILGTAGAVLALVAAFSVFPESVFLERAVSCGKHLLKGRFGEESGYKTGRDEKGGPLLTGFSHGAAGVAYALLRLYQYTQHEAFLEAARQAIDYEQSVFLPEVGNWPDFRVPKKKGRYAAGYSWCQGAPGIGLARVGGLGVMDSPEIRRDIDAAINTVRRNRIGVIDQLCCGGLGIAEFLLSAGRKLREPEMLENAGRAAAYVAARADKKGNYGFGLEECPYFFGMFQGLAGIGYQFLRLAFPERVPSILLFE